MSIWNELINSPCRTSLPELYQHCEINIDIRGKFAEWFETQSWELNNDDQNVVLLSQLEEKIDVETYQAPDVITQMRFLQCKKQFHESFAGNPQKFVANVCKMLHEEKMLLQSSSSSPEQLMADDNINSPPMSPVINNLQDAFIHLQNSLMELEKQVRDRREDQEALFLKFDVMSRIQTEITQVRGFGVTPQPGIQKQIDKLEGQRMTHETNLKADANKLKAMSPQILMALKVTTKYISSIVCQLQTELIGWRSVHQKSLSGVSKPDRLDELQMWCQTAADFVIHLHSIAVQFRLLINNLPTTKSEEVDQLLDEIMQQNINLLKWSFIVTKPPPQVLKKQLKFQASVRLLVGQNIINMVCPEVSVSLLSEKQCQELSNGETPSEVGTCGEVLNCKTMMEYNKDTKCLEAEFKNLKIKDIKRQDRKGQESVLEAKSALLFSMKLTVWDKAEVEIYSLTVPIVMIVHGNQIPNSEATIFWDNMFSVAWRIPFHVPDEVTWKEMANGLNFLWTNSMEVELHSEHLEYLKEKIFSHVEDKDSITPGTMVSWSLFNKEPVRGRSFTFWEWFHCAINVVKRHLKGHWKDQCLEFMTRQTAQKKLLTKPPGTFIIRFSDGELGSVSIAWKGNVEGKSNIWFLQPWSSKDFTIRSLADRIFDLPDLRFLHPDTQKEIPFARYQTKEVIVNDISGYVPAGLVATIVKPPNVSSTSSTPTHSNFDVDYSTFLGNTESMSLEENIYDDRLSFDGANIQDFIMKM